MVNAGVLFWLLVWPQLQQSLSGIAESNAADTSTSRAVEVPAASEGPDLQKSSNGPTAAVAASDVATQQAAETRAPADNDVIFEPVRELVRLDRLPAEVRRRFPGLAFSTHVYAEDRDLRAVVANGKRLTEGDSLRGVTVDEITATGVILAFDDYLIEVPVIGSWE
jgi:hypothetical protein